MNTLNEMLRAAMKPTPAKPVKPDKPARKGIVLDDADDDAVLSSTEDYTIKDISLAALASIHEWVETDDLDDGESYADRLMALMIGIADINKDGDITDDEQGVLDVALNAAWDYLVKCGVSDEDAGALLNDWDNDAADRIRDLVASVLPEGDADASAAIDDFVFSDDDQEPALDAVYRKKMVIRGGHKMRINKRVSGTVRLTGAQKIAIKKARMKSHSASAMMHRMKSMRMHQKMGL